MEPKIYKPSIYNGAGIYKTGAGGGGGGFLPIGYRKLSYIQTDGNSYCDIVLDDTIICQARQVNFNFTFSQAVGDNKEHNVIGVTDENDLDNLFGYTSYNSQVAPGLFIKNPSWTGSNHSLNVYANPENTCIIEKNNTNTFITSFGIYGSSIQNLYNNIKKIHVFSPVYIWRGSGAGVRVLDSFILDASNDKVVFTLLPCYEIATGLYGFFDVIGGKFYSATTGTFTGGL